MTESEGERARAVVDKQFETYSAKDLDGYMSCFAGDAEIHDFNGALLLKGAAEIRAWYERLWTTYPDNTAKVLNRIVCASIVINHEEVQRSPDEAVLEMTAIYSVRDDRIARIDFIRA